MGPEQSRGRFLHRPGLTSTAGALLLAGVAVLAVLVGRHPGEPGTVTTLPLIGRIDRSTYDAVQRVHVAPLTWPALVLNFLGLGVFAIPFRIAVTVAMAVRRRFAHAAVFVATWIFSELSLTLLKGWVERARPLDPLVATHGFSFPSGHAVAGASIGVSLVLAALAPGPRRREWELAAAGFAFLMGLSRVYLNAHWLSDAAVGVLLGTGVAIACAGVVEGVIRALNRRPDGGP